MTAFDEWTSQLTESSNLPIQPSHPAGGRNLGRPVHGNIQPAELRRLGLDPAAVIDFSASISPIGPPQGLWDALRQVDLTVYPDPENLALREALAAHHSIGTEKILVGNGSTEIIHLLARVYLSQGESYSKKGPAFLLMPTYGEYLGACRLSGASVFSFNAEYRGETADSGGFWWDLDTARRHIVAQGAALVFVCNPNNPTGVYLSRTDIEELAEATTEAGGLLVVDEAYVNFVEEPWDAVPLLERGNVVLLRSMTKDYALTGLRLGYALAGESVIESLAAFQPDWSVNSLAQAAGLVALADVGYLPRARQAVEEAKTFLTREFNSAGFAVLPSAANFLLVRVGDGRMVRERLLNQGLVVRDCASFGLADCIRVGIRRMEDCRQLAEAIRGLGE